MGAAKLLTAAGGAITLDAASTATDKTITIPAVTGTMVYVDTGGSVVLPRVNSGSEGGQIDFQRASDAVVTWSIDSYGSTSAPVLRFLDGSNERMRIDGSGYLRLNNTDAGNYLFKIKFAGDAQEGIGLQSSYSGAGNMMRYLNSAGTTVGQITTTNTTTSFVTSSDYRLKENVQPLIMALDTVAALKPCTYTWKIDGSGGQGFIAHELQLVAPDAVVGEKDAVDEDGNPKYQGIDTSFLVATLTAAIQELKAIVDAQAQRITALEGTQQ